MKFREKIHPRLSEFETENLLKRYGLLKEKRKCGKLKKNMAYKDFTFADIENKLGVKQQYTSLFDKIAELKEPSKLLKEVLERNTSQPLTTEKMVSEAIVFPVLQEIRDNNINKVQLFSGEIIKADKEKGLNGECDFVFSKHPVSPQLKNPIIQVTEAKKGEVDNARSLSQTAAQMIGVRIFNQKYNKQNPVETIYGACTTGYEWIFLKLEENTVFIDTERYYLVKLPELLGILQKVVDFYD
jgi:hypothetical protein